MSIRSSLSGAAYFPAPLLVFQGVLLRGAPAGLSVLLVIQHRVELALARSVTFFDQVEGWVQRKYVRIIWHDSRQ